MGYFLWKLRRFYWKLSITTRSRLNLSLDWLVAVIFGLMLAWFAAQGV